MSEQKPRKSNPSPSPFNLAILLIVIALVALVVGLFSFGAFGNRPPQPYVIKQAQAVESPTIETVEAPTDVPTSDVIATLVVTETATLEISPTPSETDTEPTSSTSTQEPTQEPSQTLAADTPTRTDNSTTESSTLEPTLAPEQTPTQELPTVIPPDEEGAILYVSDSELYSQPVNNRGRVTDQRNRIDLSTLPGGILYSLVSPSEKDIFLAFHHAGSGCTDACEPTLGYAIHSVANGDITVIEPPSPDFYGWHPDSNNLIFGGESGKVYLFDVRNQKSQVVVDVDKWLGTQFYPIIHGVAFSPDGNQLIVAFGLPGQGIDYQAWVANSDGSNTRKAMEGGGPYFAFTWSPDGKQIAFINRGLEVIDRNGENRRTVSKNISVGWGFLPRWSPDSSALAFEASEELPPYPGYRGGLERIFQEHKMHIVDLATLEERRVIADEQGGDIQGAWSPDAKRMMVLSNRSGTTELWVVNLQNGNLEQISADGQLKRTRVDWLAEPLGEAQ